MTSPDLRTEYETCVRALRRQAEAMQREGAAPEAIARRLHAMRQQLAAAFKARTPEPLRTRIQARTVATYGSPEGPSIEALRAGGKRWEDIIESACRPGARFF
ncbi:MAG: hypothetical protein J0H67_17535 [Rhodospirillales bacterium]|nr:hypothetical protein [Rhodospirillales bacterium]